jgi:hypothetical protein
MSDHPVQPDLEKVVVAALRASTSLDGTFADRISTRLPPEPTYPYLTLRQTGASRPVERWLVGATVEFVVWGAVDGEPAARAAANLAESVVLGLVGPYDAAVVSGVEPVIGPRNVTDPETGRPRYIFEVRVFAHPVAA